MFLPDTFGPRVIVHHGAGGTKGGRPEPEIPVDQEAVDGAKRDGRRQESHGEPRGRMEKGWLQGSPAYPHRAGVVEKYQGDESRQNQVGDNCCCQAHARQRQGPSARRPLRGHGEAGHTQQKIRDGGAGNVIPTGDAPKPGVGGKEDGGEECRANAGGGPENPEQR